MKKWLNWLAKCEKRRSSEHSYGYSKKENKKIPFRTKGLMKNDYSLFWGEDGRMFIEKNNAQDILEDPLRRFNGNRMISLCPTTVITPKGYKNIYVVQKRKWKTLTVLPISSVDGNTLLPIVIYTFIHFI